MKKFFINFGLILSFSIMLFASCSSVFSEQRESKVTVRIINDVIEVPENSNKDDPDKSKELREINKLPKTNEFINSNISLIGMFFLAIGILRIYVNNRKNGENKNEKN